MHRMLDVKAFSSYCMEEKENKKQCLVDLKLLLSSTPLYYGALYTLKNSNNLTILKAGKMDTLEGDDSAYSLTYMQENGHNFRYEKLFRKLNISQSDIDNITYIEPFDAYLEIKKFAAPPILMATFRSLSFSIADWVPMLFQGEYKKAIDFILHIAFPRSWPAILFGIISLFIYKYIKYEEKRHLKKLELSDQKLLEALRYEKATIIPDLEKYSDIIDRVVPTKQLINFIKTYPKGVATECRLIGEMLVKNISSSCQVGDQSEKIRCLYKSGIISKKTKSNLDTIRLLGNLAVHETDAVITENDALLALNALISIFNSPQIK